MLPKGKRKGAESSRHEGNGEVERFPKSRNVATGSEKTLSDQATWTARVAVVEAPSASVTVRVTV